MNWTHESWLKLYTRLTGDWLQLSAIARGLGCELLKYAKDDGVICKTRSKAPAVAVALLLCSRPEEFECVTSAIEELIEDGYLEVIDDRIRIRNFVTAQERRSSAAIRQAKKRERDRQLESGVTNGHAKVTGKVTPKVTPLSRDVTGSDPIRSDPEEANTSPSASPPGFDFELVYQLYPRKIGKKKGLQRCRSQIKTREKYDALLRAVRNYAQEMQGTAETYIKHFDSWMNGHWEDYAERPAKPESISARLTRQNEARRLGEAS